MSYSQFCPIAKASELIGEKWTLLIIREILSGGRRFSELQRGLTGISPTMLSRRLQQLENACLIVRKTGGGERKSAYLPTDALHELQPILMSLGSWGMRYARNSMEAQDYNVDVLMLYMERTIRADRLPKLNAVLHFHFEDRASRNDWWLICTPDSVHASEIDPSTQPDMTISANLRDFAEVWVGSIDLGTSLEDGRMALSGRDAFKDSFADWFQICEFEA